MTTVKKITSFFLAILFLVSSLGFTINRMVCLKSGKVKVSLVHEKECCPSKRSELPVIKSKCCDIMNSYFNLGDFHESLKQNIDKPLVAEIPFNFSTFSVIPFTSSQERTVSFADLPPPSGRQLLSLISVLII